ncbi:hypothetical protein F3N42_07360 [Marinihelvus fidelis]|uniref:YMGG-like Gly-zipper domain-containing protein n=1 Tax=Marinihelvus fidelis TaxID=2613842 RepID=A0A5N0TAJ1_9GAMM|nr:YMGG-like glycine zipper-containing protein [Marinihelvus fidelis]KAA9131982.1 hypothetical protein F3N42_07360 [Marinihelvus fidelis]
MKQRYQYLVGLALLASLSLLAAPAAWAQGGQQSLAGTLGIYVFPSKGQDSTQQSEDEAACYKWAVSNSGVDPFDAQKQQEANAEQAAAAQQQAAQAGSGSTARSAVGGAAVGALIGEIADDDAGKGAAWGAGLGAIRGHRRGNRERAESQMAAAEQSGQAEAHTAAQIDGFKKAFSACMEGKDYIAKF